MLLFHIVRLLLRFSERVFLVLVLAFFDLITFNCVFQFLFLIAMTWHEKVMLGIFLLPILALYVGGGVGGDDHRHQKLPLT